MIKKFSLSLAVISAILVSTGCGAKDKDKKSSKTDELPYGATMQVNKTDLPFPIEFDNRFLNDSEMTAVVNYFYSVETNDATIAETASYPPYISNLAKSVGFDSVEAFLKNLDGTIAGYLNTDDYSYSYINVTSCNDENDKDVYTYFNELDKMLAEAESESGSEEDILSKVESRKLVSVDITCDVNGESVSLTDVTGEQQVYIYTIDGTAYVL